MNATKQALTELKKLAATAADNLYRRIELAITVLADLDWIATEYGGSDIKAQDALQTEFFRDLGGLISLGKLMAMYRAVAKSDWAKCRYDLAAVEVLYDDRAEPEKAGEKGVRTAWKAIAEERLAKIEQLEKQVAQFLEANGRLREEATEAKARASRYEGRIEELEKIAGRQLVGAR